MISPFLDVLKGIARETLLSPVFFGVLLAVMAAEQWMPANPKQKRLSAGFFQDALWAVFALIFTGTVVAAYASWLQAIYRTHLDFLTLHALEQLPEAARMAIAVVAGDFLAWFQHWLKHKVPWFWRIHAVHHSQRELNLFTDFRFHFLEYFISRPIVLLPMMALSVEPPKVAAYVLFTTWYTRIYHANIRTNYGLLRYLLVTPQSHRVHHSIERRHHDLNFGVIFSFWDRLFKTHNADATVYPATGIQDAAFPLEAKESIPSLAWTFLRQSAYPFRS